MPQSRCVAFLAANKAYDAHRINDGQKGSADPRALRYNAYVLVGNTFKPSSAEWL
jgi:hypothetical protein